MILFTDGISITKIEYLSLLHVEMNPDQWLQDIILEKARLRRDALIAEWRLRLLADPSVGTFPAESDLLVQFIMARSDYKTRLQKDALESPPAPLNIQNILKFKKRIVDDVMVTLVPSGINISSLNYDCILAYVQNVQNWILGALLGHINRGKKKMIQQYYPILLADPTASIIPSNEDELIQAIVQYKDYTTLVRR